MKGFKEIDYRLFERVCSHCGKALKPGWFERTCIRIMLWAGMSKEEIFNGLQEWSRRLHK